MRLLFIAIASSLLLAAIVTGINLRFLGDAPVAAFAVTAIAMFVVAVVNARTALRTYVANAPSANADASGRNRNRGKQNRSADGQNRNRKGGRNDNKPANKQSANKAAGKPANAADDSKAHEGTPVTGDYETGAVKWFSRSKGFGFIVRPNGEEIFVHHRSVRAEGERRPSLRDGEAVRYIVTDHDKGLQAEDVSAA